MVYMPIKSIVYFFITYTLHAIFKRAYIIGGIFLFSKLRYPIIQAPMAGGVATPALAIAVSQNGGLGFLAAGYKTADQIEAEIKQCIAAGVLFGVNLFVPTKEPYSDEAVQVYKERLEQDFSLELPIPTWSDDEWQEKLALVEKYKVPYVSFTFGCPNEDIVKKLQTVGCQVIVTVTDVYEATIANKVGANALCLQGLDAGGHRGSFQNTDPQQHMPLDTLIAEVKRAVDIPIIAAGGIINGQQIKSILAAGANAVQLGTAFICCHESGANTVYKKALLDGDFQETAFTRAFTGRLARGLKNDFIEKYEHYTTLAYPTLHYITQPIRKRAVEQHNPHAMSLWAGTGFKQVQAISVEKLMQQLAVEANL